MFNQNIETVTRFKTGDGRLFDTLEEAKRHLKAEELSVRIRNELGGYELDPFEVAEWVVDNLDFTFKTKLENQNV